MIFFLHTCSKCQVFLAESKQSIIKIQTPFQCYYLTSNFDFMTEKSDAILIFLILQQEGNKTNCKCNV